MREDISIINFNNKIPLSFTFINFDSIKTHVHSEIQLILVLEGRCKIKVEENIYEAKEDDIIAINPFVYHSLESDKSATIISILIDPIGFQVDEIEARTLKLNLNTVVNPINKRYDAIRYLIYSIIKYNTMENVNEIYTNRAIAYSFFAQLVNDFKISSDKVRENYLKSYTTISKITGYIKENYKNNLTLAEIAHEFNYTNEYLSRLFKSSINQTFIEYYDSIRLNYAYRDLINSNLSIEEIALNNGFNDPRNFVRAFKKIYKEYPSKYRKDYILKEGTLKTIKEGTLTKRILDKIINKYEKLRNTRNEDKETIRDTESIVNINFLSQGIKNNQSYLFLIDLNDMNLLNYDDVKANLTLAQKEINFKYITLSNLFDVIKINEDNSLNFIYFDIIIRFLNSINLKPYLKINLDDEIFNKNNTLKIILSLLNHLYKEFDYSYLKNSLLSFSYKNKDKLNSEDLKELYKNIYTLNQRKYRFIKFVNPSFIKDSILNNPDYLKKIKEFLKESISFDYYSFDYLINENETLLNRNENDVKDFLEYLKNNELYFENKMLIERINFSNSNSNLLNDTIYSSSYLTKLVIDNNKSLNAFSKYTFLDLSIKKKADNDYFFGGSGLINSENVKKSSYYAYKLFAKLGDFSLKKDSNYLITKKDNKLIILVNNYNHYSSLYAKNEYYEINNLNRYACFPKSTNIHFRFIVNNAKYKKAIIKSYKISSDSASPFDTYLSSGYQKLDKEEIELLKNLSEMKFKKEEIKLQNETLKFDFKINPLETELFEIEFIN